MKRIFLIKILILILSFYSCCLYAKVVVTYALDNPIIIGEVKNNLEQFSYLFDKSYGLKDSNYTINVQINDKKNILTGKPLKEFYPEFVSKGSFVSVVVPPNFKFQKNPDDQRRLILMTLFAANDITGSVEIENLQQMQWLLAGLQRAIKSRGENFIEVYESFPIINNLMQDGGQITYSQILYGSFLPNDGVLYDYYQEESQLLLETILSLKNGHSFLRDYIDSCIRNPKLNAIDLFNELLSKYKNDFDLRGKDLYKDFNLILNKFCYDKSINPTMPLGAEYSLSAFDKASMYYDSKRNEKMTLLLLYSYIKSDSTDSEKILDQKIAELKGLYSKLNFMLLSPVKNIVYTLTQMRNGKDYSLDDYSREINKNVSTLKSLIKRLSEIEVQLHKVSQQYDTFQEKYGKKLESIRSNENTIDKTWPELFTYMKEKHGD